MWRDMWWKQNVANIRQALSNTARAPWSRPCKLKEIFFVRCFFGTMMILRGSLLTQGVTSSSRAWSPWVSSETLMILNLRGSAVFTFWSNLELGQRKNGLFQKFHTAFDPPPFLNYSEKISGLVERGFPKIKRRRMPETKQSYVQYCSTCMADFSLSLKIFIKREKLQAVIFVSKTTSPSWQCM